MAPAFWFCGGVDEEEDVALDDKDELDELDEELELELPAEAAREALCASHHNGTNTSMQSASKTAL